jgi:hypothetical protein
MNKMEKSLSVNPLTFRPDCLRVLTPENLGVDDSNYSLEEEGDAFVIKINFSKCPSTDIQSLAESNLRAAYRSVLPTEAPEFQIENDVLSIRPRTRANDILDTETPKDAQELLIDLISKANRTTIEEIQRQPNSGRPLNSLRVFRGQADSNWSLVPKIARGVGMKDLTNDLPELMERSGESSALGAMGFAQHYGLATSLLDWTSNLLVALKFAIGDSPPSWEVPGALFTFSRSRLDHINSQRHTQLNFGWGVTLVNVKSKYYRINSQKGLFTYHRPANFPLIPDSKYILEPNVKIGLLEILRNWGITWEFLMGDNTGTVRDFYEDICQKGS